MRLYSAVFLLGIILLNLFGFYLSFFVSKGCVKMQVAKRMNTVRRSALEQFEFSFADYKQLARPDGDEDELLINGAMYDVKSTEVKAGKVVVYAKRDTAETNLIAKFLTVFDNGSSSDNEDSDLLIKVMQQDFVWEYTPIVINTSGAVNHFDLFDFIFSTRTGDHLTPPPDCFKA
jgi:hypothetical protein